MLTPFVGTIVGTTVGETVGEALGETVGLAVGLTVGEALGLVLGLVLGLGDGEGEATITVPFRPVPWSSEYGKEPGDANGTGEDVAPGWIAPVSKLPSFAVAECAAVSLFIQITLPPAVTFTGSGEYPDEVMLTLWVGFGIAALC